jgi:hypothetical protein
MESAILPVATVCPRILPTIISKIETDLAWTASENDHCELTATANPHCSDESTVDSERLADVFNSHCIIDCFPCSKMRA